MPQREIVVWVRLCLCFCDVSVIFVFAVTMFALVTGDLSFMCRYPVQVSPGGVHCRFGFSVVVVVVVELPQAPEDDPQKR